MLKTVSSLRQAIIGCLIGLLIIAFNTVAYGAATTPTHTEHKPGTPPVVVKKTDKPTDTVNTTSGIKKEWPKGKVPILLYHHLDPKGSRSAVVVTPEKFESDLKALKQAGFTTIHFSELTACIKGESKWPEKPIIITFDDGYASNYKYAFPLLKKYHMKASFFVIGWSAGRQSYENSDEEINPHFSWQEAGEMSATGLVEIQNHTYDLHSEKGYSYGEHKLTGRGVARLEGESEENYLNRLVKDFCYNSQLITKATGIAPTILAFPMGVHNELSNQAVFMSGMFGSVTVRCGVRIYKAMSDLVDMPRINVDMAKTGDKLIEWIEKQSNL